MITADDALARLVAGNQRFASQTSQLDKLVSHTHVGQPVRQQAPFAIVLCCSDARVPAEIIFDQGMGDLFVIRVAGNIVTPPLLGSVEYSIIQHQCRLVVVLGHTHCGAVEATFDALQQPSSNHSPNLQSIINHIAPSVQTVLEAGLHRNESHLLKLAVRANIRASMAQLQTESSIIEQCVRDDQLRIVGAEYSLETGQVGFLDDENSGACAVEIRERE